MSSDREKVVIIGAGIAGRNVARELLGRGKSTGITLIKKEKHASYSPCGLPYVLSGEIKRPEDVLFPNFDRKLEKSGVDVKAGVEVKKIDPEGKKVFTGDEEALSYDHLVIATGRKPAVPPLPGIEKEGVHTLSNYEDLVRIYDEIDKVKKVVVVGAGFIGCETASALVSRGMETVLVEIKPHILPLILDESMASLVEDKLTSAGVRLLTGKKLSRIEGEGRVKSVFVEGEESSIPADLVVVAAGIRPDTALAETAGLEIGKLGGLLTDYLQRVKKDGKFLPDVYALGDCVEVKDRMTGKETLYPLTDMAIVQARVVAAAITGDTDPSWQKREGGEACSSLTVVGGLEIGSVGVTTITAEKAQITPRQVRTRGLTREVYFPGVKKTHIKLLAHEDCLIGAQIIGEENVREVLNEVSVLIHDKVKIGDIFLRTRSYTPPLSASPDVLMRALEKLIS